MGAATSRDEAARGAAGLKLRARDPEDLHAMAVVLQDAIVPMSEIAYLPAEHRFVLVANRFRWEAAKGEVARPNAEPEPTRDAKFEDDGDNAQGPVFERVHCGVCFDLVHAVRSRGLDRAKRERLLNLLTIRAAPGTIELLFSEDVAIRLEVGQIRAHIEDLGEPWPTRWRPAHPEDASESDDASKPR